jgi:probable F420-dependent oxidoreductase
MEARMKIGVIPPIAEQEAYGGAPGWPVIRSYAKRAEALGFDSLWIYDHLLYRWPNDPVTHGLWECWTTLTALAEATERVELGTIVLCVPFRNPALLAKMAVTLDEISGGRLILGLGAGWHQPEFDAFGYSFDHLASRFEEGLAIIAPLLREGQVDFTGEYYAAPNSALVPRGPRPHGPPILIASFKPRMLDITAKYADQWNTAWFGTVDGVAARRAELEAACKAIGRDPATIEITVGVSIAYPEAGAEIPPREKVLTGSASEIAADLKRYEEAGVSHLICNIDPQTEAALELFAEAVANYRQG